MPYTRSIVLLAFAVLGAAPAAAQARPAAQIDPCTGRPVVRQNAGAGAQGPRLLGVPAGQAQAPSGAAQPETAGSSTSATPDAASGAASSTSASGAAASSTSASGAAASSTSAGGAAISPSGNPGTATSSTSAADGPEGRADASDAPADGRTAARNRAAMRLGMGPLGDKVRLGPAASVSIPTALGVDAGEMFFGVAYQGRTRYTDADDAAAVVGIGIGTRRVLALEAALTTYSTLRGDGPLETGGLSLKLHRALPRQTSVAVGYENALLWGGSDGDGSLYAVASRSLNLRDDPSAPFSTAVATVGVGNGRFRFEEDDAEDRETVNLFAGLGVRVVSQLSLVADWTGQDLNAAASITPAPRLPLVITLGLADLTGSAGDGVRPILSLGYGLAFRQPF